jgi:endonuclease/exonuclease/phosphatase family metal-dependent hydrolase
MLSTEIKVKNKILLVINLHGLWGGDGGDNEVRDAIIEKILEKIKDNQNVIVAGDFNMNPQTKAIRRLEKRLVNVF